MRTAFEIKEAEPATSDTQVLIEVGEYGLSVLKFRKDPLTIEAVAAYNFSEEQNSRNAADNFQEVITDNHFDNKDNLHVFYNFREALLIPAEFMQQESYSAQLALLYGNSPDAEVAYEEITVDSGIGRQDNLFCVYRTPKGLRSLVAGVSSNKARHSTSEQVKLKGTNVLHCTIFHNTIKLFLYSRNSLLLVQQYGYKTPADVVYHLLNVCDKHAISPGEVSLYIDGMIDSESSLYQEIYKYFLHIHFNVIADDIFLSAAIKEHPLHFITHLSELARCV